jgi:hypothetical protein
MMRDNGICSNLILKFSYSPIPNSKKLHKQYQFGSSYRKMIQDEISKNLYNYQYESYIFL